MKIWKNLKKVWAFIMTAILCSCIGTLTVMASENFDISRNGSIEIRLTDSSDEAEPLNGIDVSLYKIADAKKNHPNLVFEVIEQYKVSGFSPERLSDASEALEEALKVNDYIAENGIAADQKLVTSKGVSYFSDLSCGLYLLVSRNSEGYDVSHPFIVAIPMMNAEETGWNYDIKTQPKAELIKGAAILNKISTSGKRLEGAVFKLERKAFDGSWRNFASDLVTDSSGQIIQTNLPYGDYKFTELKAPNGYQINTSPREFSIYMSGDVVYRDGKYEAASSGTAIINVVNRKEGTSGGSGSDPKKPGDGGGGDPETPNLELIPDADVPLKGLTGISENISIILGQEVPLSWLPQTGQDIRRIMFFFAAGMALIIYGMADIKRERKGKKNEEK